jgi:hypothetical protein
VVEGLVVDSYESAGLFTDLAMVDKNLATLHPVKRPFVF